MERIAVSWARRDHRGADLREADPTGQRGADRLRAPAPSPEHPDRVRWNARYRDQAPPRPERPLLLHQALAADVPAGPVLELACGASAAALALAEMGRVVTAVDVSDAALELLAGGARALGLDARIEVALRDLYVYRPPTRTFALVLCRDFWDPAVFVVGCDAASVGGVVAWEGFVHDPAQGRPPPIDPRYCLAPGEPASLLPAGFRLLEQVERGEPGRRRVAMLARRVAGISFVTPWLAIGGAVRHEGDVQELLDAGISHVVNCQVRVDDAPLLRCRFDYLWNPAEDDGEAKPADWFLRAVDFVSRARENPDARVLVHCTEGRARAPAIAYGVLRASGHSADHARRAVLAARPAAQPRYFDDAERALGEETSPGAGGPARR